MPLPEARVVRGRAVSLAAAPRRVPWRLVWRVWFGGTTAFVGWVMAAAGTFASGLFLPQIEWPFASYDAQATATVERVEYSGMKSNKDRIYRVHYRFLDARGTTHVGASYTKSPPDVGSTRAVEYDDDDAGTSRLVDMRAKPFGLVPLFVLVFPAVGYGFALRRLRRAIVETRLLRTGVATTGKLVSAVATSEHENDVPVMEMTFEFTAAGGATHRAIVRTVHREVLEDDAREPMVYDPRDPSRATTLDHLPGAPAITADGQLASRPGIAVHYLLLPAATLASLVFAVRQLL